MKALYFIVIAVLFQSCFSINNLVEADAIGQKQKSHQFAGEAFTPLGEFGGWGMFEYQFGYGISDELDLRIAVNTNRAADLQLKYTLTSTEKRAFALGVSVDNDIFFVRRMQPQLLAFYTYKTAKYNIMLNPALEFNATTYAVNPDQNYGPVANFTAGLSSQKDKRWKIGLNLGYAPNADSPFLAGIGLAYDIRTN